MNIVIKDLSQNDIRTKRLINHLDLLFFDWKEQPDLDDESLLTPIQDALYATGKFTTDDCSTLAEGILQYIRDAGMNIICSNRLCDAMGHYGGSPKPSGLCPKCNKAW